MAQLFMQIVDAIISHGCFLRECSVQHSIVGVRSRLESGVEFQVTLTLFFFPPTFLRVNCVPGKITFWK